MAGSGTAANARRAGKFNKPSRGGGKHYSRGLQPVDADGHQVSMWSADSQKRSDAEDESGSSEASSSEDDDASQAAGTSKLAAAAAEANRENRKAQKKARKDAAIAKQKTRVVEVGDMPSSGDEESSNDDMPANPNHSKAARNMTKDVRGVEGITEGVQKMKTPTSRREREAVEAAAAKERYMKLHAQGKTDEAKADMARLKLIREQRAAESARRQAEKDEKDEQEKTRRAEVEAKEAKKREAAAGPKKTSKKK